MELLRQKEIKMAETITETNASIYLYLPNRRAIVLVSLYLAHANFSFTRTNSFAIKRNKTRLKDVLHERRSIARSSLSKKHRPGKSGGNQSTFKHLFVSAFKVKPLKGRRRFVTPSGMPAATQPTQSHTAAKHRPINPSKAIVPY